MRKVNKNITRIVAILLALVMISACVLSSTFAKYVTTKKTSPAKVVVTQFGVTVTPHSDLYAEYNTTASGVVEVEVNAANTSNLIAPGTRGALACFEVTSTDVPWYIDINGTISIGDGYKASSKLILNENGDPIDYFPIVIYLYRYDWSASANNGQGGYVESNVKVAHSVCRLTPNAPKGMTTESANDKNVNITGISGITNTTELDGRYRMSLTSENRAYNVARLQDKLNLSNNTSLNGAFDDMGANNTGNAAGTKSLFVVEWCWPYNNAESYKQESTAHNKKSASERGFMEYYYYQTRELDTQLAEAMKKAPNAFNITLNLTAKVSQANGVKS